MTSLLLIEMSLDKAVQLAESEQLPGRYTRWAAELIDELYSLGYQQEEIKVFPPPMIPLFWYRNRIGELQVAGPKAAPLRAYQQYYTFNEPIFNGSPMSAVSGMTMPAQPDQPVYGYTTTGNLSSGGFANVRWNMGMSSWDVKT